MSLASGSRFTSPHLVLALQPKHDLMIRAHLKALGEYDRRLRFGMLVSDAFIDRYADSFDFSVDAFFGVIDRNLNLLGLAHLAYAKESPKLSQTAEFGVSVAENGRGVGIGTALFKRASIHARNTQIKILYVHCLSSNAAMMHIASKAGMRVENAQGEADAFLSLLPADPDSRFNEAIQDQAAVMDFSVKKNHRQVVRIFQRLFPYWYPKNS